MIVLKLGLILILTNYHQLWCLCKSIEDLSPIDVRDEVLAFLFNYGDPNFEYPSFIKLKEACNLEQANYLDEMKVDLMKMIINHYQNKVVSKAAHFMFNEPIISKKECQKTRGPMSRVTAINNQIKEMNARRFDAKDYRDFLEKALAEAVKPNTKFKLPLIACYLDIWMEKTIEKYPERNGIRKRVAEHTHNTFNLLIDYLYGMNKDNVQCDFNNLPPGPSRLRFQSIQMNLLEAIDNISQKK